ncbi:hypothetical protein DM01DRAFT_1335265 [Hesseltinella vesiculosa]|uniref:ARM repeat-containing protein n=1 Tax=Hesseltinella vesiculosa TaxID=101127 RepID=A0A1X2GK54_9FUNG|nr:hypothetical protein DM01DRAFT_1335265 [Hesseltinella vesiculosa]
MSHEHQQRKDLYARLKATCVPLLDSKVPMTLDDCKRAAATLYQLDKVLQAIDDPEMVLDMALIDTILFPLLHCFKTLIQSRISSDQTFEALLRCFLFLLAKTIWPLTFDATMLKQCLMLFTTCLQVTNNSSSSSGALDDIKVLTIQCLGLTLPIPLTTTPRSPLFLQSQLAMHLRPVLKEDTFKGVLAQCAAELLACAQRDMLLDLRLLALDTVRQLLHDNINDPVLLAPIFPGLTSVLCKIVWQKQEKEHHQVIAYTLTILADLICIVMNDERLENHDQEPASLQELTEVWRDQNKKQEKGDDLKGEDDDWLATTRTALHGLLRQVAKVRLHAHWQVRLAFVDLAGALLEHCLLSLPDCLPICLDTLVLAVDDDMHQVAGACQDVLIRLRVKPIFTTQVVPLLKQGLYDAMTQLPRRLISGDEGEKANACQHVIGHVKILQEPSSTVLDTILSRVTDGWLAALEIDVHGLQVLDEQSAGLQLEMGQNTQAGEMISEHVRRFPTLRFKHLASDASSAQAMRMLQVIGAVSPEVLQRWLDHFLSYVLLDPLAPRLENVVPQAALVVYGLLTGGMVPDKTMANRDGTAMMDLVDGSETLDGGSRERQSLATLTNQLLVDMVDSLTAATSCTTSKDLTTSLSPASSTLDASALASIVAPSSLSATHAVDLEQNLVVTVCLQLQIVSLAAGLVPGDLLQDHLMTLLYPMLAHLGSKNVAIHEYALTALDNVAVLCGQPNAADLAVANVDYIINAVSRRISLLLDNPQAPLVLTALIHVTGASSLSYLQDSIDEVFDALTRYHQHPTLCLDLCSVLFETVRAAAASAPPLPLLAPAHEKPSPDHTSQPSPSILRFIQQYRDSRPASDSGSQPPKSIDDIGQFFLDQRDQGKTDEDLLDHLTSDKEATADPNGRVDDAPTTSLSSNEELVWTILTHAIHFLSSPSPALRAKMIQLVVDGVRVLAHRTDKLNVLVNDLWPILLHRLDDSVPYVTFYAVMLIQAFAKVSGDFIESRFMKDVWPRFQRYLQQGQQAGMSLNYSTYSYPHRLQRCVLETLILVVQFMQPKQPVVADMARASEWLLSDQVHPDLQSLTCQLYTSLYAICPDTLWFVVFAMTPMQSIAPPSQLGIALSPFILPAWLRKQDKHFFTNASLLLHAFNPC